MDNGSTLHDHDADQQETAALTYEHVADVYDDLYQDRDYIAENRLIQAWLRDILPRKADVVDIGCGTGLLYELLPQFNYFGFDPCIRMISKFREKHAGVAVAKAAYGDINLSDACFKVALFGVPNYIQPEVLDVTNLSRYFLMFYQAGYRPSYYHPPRNEPYLGYEFEDYDIGDSYVTQFSNYLIVTDLV